MARSKNGRKIGLLKCPYCERKHTIKTRCAIGFGGALKSEPVPIRTYPAKKPPCGCGG